MSEILLSLGDGDLKRVADVLGSRSAVRILEVLGEENLSVGDLARRLGMRLNTVDYNVRKLLKAGLIEKVSHLWSVKGRRVVLYRACNRRIVISPVGRVRNFLLGWLGVGVVALGLREALSLGGENVMQDGIERAVFVTEETLAVKAGAGVSFWGGVSGLEWFLAGVWVGVFGFFVYAFLKEKLKGTLEKHHAFFVDDSKKMKGGVGK